MDKVSIKWREQYRQQRRDKAARLKLINELKTGMVIESKYFEADCCMPKKQLVKLYVKIILVQKYAYTFMTLQ